MKRYLVRSGDIEEIVEAEDELEAAAKVFRIFDVDDEPPSAGEFLSTIEVIGDELWHLTKDCLIRAGRWAGSIDVNTAEKSSGGIPPSNG